MSRNKLERNYVPNYNSHEARDQRKCHRKLVSVLEVGSAGAMKHASNSRLFEILRNRELELFALRRGFSELRDKFFQLENAFGINLRGQLRLENELQFLKLSCGPCSLRKNLSSEAQIDNLKDRRKFQPSVKNLRAERKEWKRAFLRQKRINQTQKLENSQSIETIRRECENILKTCRESGEKHFRELLRLHQDSERKAEIANSALKTSQARESSTRYRILELANLFETLEKFKGMRIETLCRCSAEALRGLATESVITYEDEMRKLRQVTWDLREDCENHETREFLQAQNAVLRQVIKRLKRKGKFVEENGESAEVAEANSDPDGIFKLSESEDKEKYEKSRGNQGDDESAGKFEQDENLDNNASGEAGNNDERRDSKKSGKIQNRIHIDAIESHKNGIPYEEYTLRLSDSRQLAFRHCRALEKKDSTLVIEFVGTEEDFQEAPLDRTVFYLGDGVESIVRVEKSGVDCGIQTRRVKNVEKFVQTTVTGSHKFCRVNAGFGMLNSERRAIEKSLASLESTLSSLKKNALAEAVSMIGKGGKSLSDEFFECVKRLES